MLLWEGNGPRWFQPKTAWDALAFMTSRGLCLHSGVAWVTSPKVLPYKPKRSRWNSTLCYLVCWNLRLCQVYSKRSQPWVEFWTWGKFWNCSAFKTHCKRVSLVLAVEPALPQGLSCNAASLDFSRSSFQNLCHNCICKEVVLGINSWLADGFTQWSLYQAPSIYRQSRSMLYWPRALKSSLLKGSSSPTPASEPLCH